MKSILRRIRGAFGNAVLWGAAWFTGALAVYGGLSLFGVVGYGFGMVIEAAVNLGIIGAIAGVGFSGFIRWRYGSMSLTEIRPRAFALAGGLASGVLIPAFVVTGRFLTGAPALELGALAVSGLVAAVLGGGTAGASLLAAQSSVAELPAASQPGCLNSPQRKVRKGGRVGVDGQAAGALPLLSTDSDLSDRVR